MKKFFALSLAILFSAAGFAALISCGGGGSSGSDVTPPAESLVGTYTLDYFYTSAFVCNSGSGGVMPMMVNLACSMMDISCDDHPCDWTPMGEVYSEAGYSVSGTLIVLDSSTHEALSFSGNTMATADSYTVIYTSEPTEGVLDYDNEIDPDFVCDGDTLTLVYEADGTGIQWTGWKFFRHAEWVKVSDEAVEPE